MSDDLVFKLLAFKSQEKIELDEKVCGKQYEEVKQCQEALLKAIKKDTRLMELYKKLDDATSTFHMDIVGHYYKEGFKSGALFGIELCGYERNSKK